MSGIKNDTKSVMVIEDDFSSRTTLQEALEFEGYKVTTAVNGKDGLDKLIDSEIPSLILLDLSMPIMSGEEFLVRLKGAPALANIPVIVLSATADTVEGIGVDAFMKKPADLQVLLEMVARRAK